MVMKAKVETITKEVALKYLETMDGNRTASQYHLMDLVRRQKRGEWVPNGDTIRFDSDGHLRDGQHRLKMVIMTEVPIETVVVTGIDPAAFITMDTGKNRNLSDVLSINHYPNSWLLAGAVTNVRRYVSHLMGESPHFSHEQQVTLLKKHAGLTNSVDFYLGLNSAGGAPGYKSQMVAWHYLFSQVSPEASNDFVERLVTGLRLDERNDPVYQLREQLVSLAKSRHARPKSGEILGIGIFAWNAKQEGREQKKAYVLPKSMPTIVGFPKNLLEVRQLELGDEGEETNGNGHE
jgi:hypothetical protein